MTTNQMVLLTCGHVLVKTGVTTGQASGVYAQLVKLTCPRCGQRVTVAQVDDVSGDVGARGEIHVGRARMGDGEHRSWRRLLGGRLYHFTTLVTPDGERRYFARQYNGYIGGTKWGCAWTLVTSWTVPRMEPDSTCTECGEPITWNVVERDYQDRNGWMSCPDVTGSHHSHEPALEQPTD